MASFNLGISPGPGQFSSPPEATLNLRVVLREGWQAFQLAPWLFTGFSLLFQSLAVIVRGAMGALNGRRPRFIDLSRVDIPAILRLLLTNLLPVLLLSMVLLPLFIAMAIGIARMVEIDFLISGAPILRSFTPTPASLALSGLSLLAAVALILYAIVSQHFRVQLSSLGRRGPWRNPGQGRAVVGRQWRSVVVLVLIESLLLGAGLAALPVGFFVAFPVAACISTAACRQLFPDAEPPASLPAA
jgi:hypothetical protein